jgi:hypothetical protein
MAPDLAGTRLYFAGIYPLQAYPEDFAAALAAKGLVWPGAPDDRSLSDSLAGRPGIDLATWVEQSDRFARFFGDGLVATAQRPDWDLLMGYLPVIDEAGHQLLLTDPRQPGFTPERRTAFEAARRRVWQSVDRELARLLGALDLRTTVVAVVSDHGMAPTHTLVDPNVLLRDERLLVSEDQGKILAAGTSAYAVSSGAIVHLYVEPGQEALLPRLRDLFTGWTVDGERPVERVFTRREAAEVQLDHPNSGDLVLLLREGYTTGNRLRERPGHARLSEFPPGHARHLSRRRGGDRVRQGRNGAEPRGRRPGRGLAGDRKAAAGAIGRRRTPFRIAPRSRGKMTPRSPS